MMSHLNKSSLFLQYLWLLENVHYTIMYTENNYEVRIRHSDIILKLLQFKFSI